MSPNHGRFLRGLVLADCRSCSLDCARYSEWENRSKSLWSWDNHEKQITLSLHHSQSYAEESPSTGLSNCYGEISHLFSVLQRELQQHKRQTDDVFSLCSDRSRLLKHSRYNIAFEMGDLFLPHSNLKPNPVSKTLVQLVPIKYTAC